MTGSADSFTTNPEAMSKKVAEWEDLSAQVDEFMAGANLDSDFGMVKPVEPSHRKVTRSSAEWTAGASNEFAALRGKLQTVIGHYDENEDAGVSTAGKIGSEGDTPV